MIYQYMSTKIKDKKNNITVSHEEGVELHYKLYHAEDFSNLEVSLNKIRETARSKY